MEKENIHKLNIYLLFSLTHFFKLKYKFKKRSKAYILCLHKNCLRTFRQGGKDRLIKISPIKIISPKIV